jgi:hypothetical protein
MSGFSTAQVRRSAIGYFHEPSLTRYDALH